MVQRTKAGQIDSMPSEQGFRIFQLQTGFRLKNVKNLLNKTQFIKSAVTKTNAGIKFKNLKQE